MKFATVIAATALLAMCVAAQDTAAFAHFENWAIRHNRIYASEEEREARYAVWSSNMADIARWNAANSGATYGEGPFTDRTYEELSATLLSASRPERRPDNYRGDAVLTSSLFIDNDDDDEQIDWRDEDGVVTPVKNQGNCGSCWAFAATEHVESLWGLKKGELFELSPQQLVDCSTADAGCNGGLEYNAFGYIMSAGGQMLEEDYPYEARKKSCRFDESKTVIQLTGRDWLTQDEKKLRNILKKEGPVDVGVAANNKWFSYSGGIMPYSDCPGGQINHGVNIVGYGNENGNKYWLVRNSWGASWGDSGYIKLEFDAGTCNINKEAAAAYVD